MKTHRAALIFRLARRAAQGSFVAMALCCSLAACGGGTGYLSPTDGASVRGGIMIGSFRNESGAASDGDFRYCIVRERDLEEKVMESCGPPVRTYNLVSEDQGRCYAYESAMRGAYPVGEERNFAMVCTTTGAIIGNRHQYKDLTETRRVLYVFFVADIPGGSAIESGQ